MWRLTQAALYSSSTLHYTGSSHSHKQTFTSAVAAGQIRQQRLSSLTFPWLYRLLDHMAVCAWKQVVTGWDLRKLRTVVSPIKTLPKGISDLGVLDSGKPWYLQSTNSFIFLTSGLVKFLQMYTINLSIIYQNEIQFVAIKLLGRRKTWLQYWNIFPYSLDSIYHFS